MTKRGRFLTWFLPALVLWALGFAAAGLWDLSINRALYNPRALFGVLMESFGFYPAFLPTLMLALLLATRRGQPPRRVWQNVAAGFVAALGFALLYGNSWGLLVGRGRLARGFNASSVLLLAAGVVLAVAAAAALWRMQKPLREKLAFLAIWGSVYMVANRVLITLLKALWARTRFDDMLAAGSLAAFTPWWQPFANGGSSFPSGHVADATGIFVLLILCDLLPALGRRRKAVTALCWAYIAAMAFSRILIGRHFLSDTLAASALMGLVFYALHRCRPYRAGLRAALGNRRFDSIGISRTKASRNNTPKDNTP